MKKRAPRVLTPDERDLLKKQIDARIRQRLAQREAIARPGGHVRRPNQAKP